MILNYGKVNLLTSFKVEGWDVKAFFMERYLTDEFMLFKVSILGLEIQLSDGVYTVQGLRSFPGITANKKSIGVSL